MPASELKTYYWNQPNGNPWGGYDSLQDKLTYGRGNPNSGRVTPKYRLACMDERIPGDGHTLRAAGSGVYSEDLTALHVIRNQIDLVTYHSPCGRASLSASVNGFPLETRVIEKHAKTQAELSAEKLDIKAGKAPMIPPQKFHIARGVFLDTTDYGVDPSTITTADNKKLFPPMITVNGGVLGQRMLTEDGPLAADIALNHGFEFFGPRSPLPIIVVYDSQERKSNADIDETRTIAKKIQELHLEKTLVEEIDMSKKRPTTRHIPLQG